MMMIERQLQRMSKVLLGPLFQTHPVIVGSGFVFDAWQNAVKKEKMMDP
jgi:hypothetical protein